MRLGNNGETPDNEPQRETDHGELNNGTDNEAGVRDVVRGDQEVNTTPVDNRQLSYPRLLMEAINQEFMGAQALLARIRVGPEELDGNATSVTHQPPNEQHQPEIEEEMEEARNLEETRRREFLREQAALAGIRLEEELGQEMPRAEEPMDVNGHNIPNQELQQEVLRLGLALEQAQQQIAHQQHQEQRLMYQIEEQHARQQRRDLRHQANALEVAQLRQTVRNLRQEVADAIRHVDAMPPNPGPPQPQAQGGQVPLGPYWLRKEAYKDLGALMGMDQLHTQANNSHSRLDQD